MHQEDIVLIAHSTKLWCEHFAIDDKQVARTLVAIAAELVHRHGFLDIDRVTRVFSQYETLSRSRGEYLTLSEWHASI